MQSNKIFIIPVVVISVFGIIIMPAIMPVIKSEPKDIPIGLRASVSGYFEGYYDVTIQLQDKKLTWNYNLEGDSLKKNCQK